MTRQAHPTQQKIETVKALSDLFRQAKGIYLADFTGLNVEQVNELRSIFFKQNVIYRVVKNTLIRQACENTGYQDLLRHLEGPTALAISLHDPVLPVRLISDFTKGKEPQAPVIKAGMLEKLYIGADQISTVKDIPSREVLLSQILSVLQSPLAGFVGVLNEVLRSFLSVLDAVIEKKKAAGENLPTTPAPAMEKQEDISAVATETTTDEAGPAADAPPPPESGAASSGTADSEKNE
jgi:large subunit ribosomal protein L10